MDRIKPLQGRMALVTGVGRRAGIGAAICREIAKNGGDVFFTYWHQYDKEIHSENSENGPGAMAAEFSQFGVRVGSVVFHRCQRRDASTVTTRNSPKNDRL